METSACRYNVRDIGFVDVGGEGYSLYAYIDASVPQEARMTMQEQGTTLERETNLRYIPVDSAAEPDHPGLKYRPAPPATGLLQGAFVSPSGQVFPVAFPPLNARFPVAWTELLNGLWSSPKREEIVRTVSQTFAAVLLVQGTSAEANQRARVTIQAGIDQIRGQMKSLPKAIAEPPVLLELAVPQLAAEKILLWSLGLGSEPSDLPVAAVFYGKGRWIGNAMKGEEITEANLMKVLSIIGADCECGIDISWTQGIRLPLRWQTDLQAQLSRSLGFDPENPLVRIEASRILNKRGTGKSQSQGYQEVTLDDDSVVGGEVVATAVPSRMEVTTAKGSGRVASAPQRDADAARSSVAQRSWVAVAAVALVVFCVGTALLLRFRLKD